MASPKQPSNIGNIFRLLLGVNIRPVYLSIPLVLGMLSAAAEGLSIALLAQLLNGFLQMDFSFVLKVPYVGAALQALGPWIGTSDRQLFGVLLTVFVVATIFKNILRYFSQISMSYFAERSMHYVRKTIFGRFLTFGKLYFDRTSVGYHANILSDCVAVGLSPLINFPKYMNAFFSFITYIGIMCFISWKLTLFAIPFFALLHVCVTQMIRRLRKFSTMVTERGNALGKKSVEILSVIPLVKAYGTEDQEKRLYGNISDEKARIDFRAVRVQQVILPFQEMITLIAAAILFCGMLYLSVEDRGVTAASFMVYFYVVVNASSKFGTLTGFRGSLARASGPVDEMLKMFDDSDKEYVPNGSAVFQGLDSSIEFRDLTFTYLRDRDVLEHVSFTIPKGKMTAIVGPTGSGKTTIIHLLMRFYDCPPGTIFVDGKDIRSFDIRSLLKHMALVSQDTLLIHDSLRSNIAYGLSDVSEKVLQEAIEQARLKELIESLPEGLETLIGDRGVKLSGGERQRVAIARALLKKSEILILDEATSSLDSRTEKLIQEAIDTAVSGRTSIVIAHRLSAIRHADKIVVIDDARIVEQGTLDELLAKKGKFHELWEQQKFH